MSRLDLPIRAAKETAERYGVVTDRCEILQDGNTLVLRLSESLVARVVTDRDGPRQGDGWFARENAVAEHLARAGAPVIPLHPGLPPGPHERHGYTMSFWQFVQVVAGRPWAWTPRRWPWAWSATWCAGAPRGEKVRAPATLSPSPTRV